MARNLGRFVFLLKGKIVLLGKAASREVETNKEKLKLRKRKELLGTETVEDRGDDQERKCLERLESLGLRLSVRQSQAVEQVMQSITWTNIWLTTRILMMRIIRN